MAIDTLAVTALAAELRVALLGGRIQRVAQPGTLSLALEIYANRQRHHLLLSAHPQHARAQLCPTRPTRGVDVASPLLLLLRKHVLRGRIIAVEQPDLERILVLSIAKRVVFRNTDDAEDAELPDPADDEEPDLTDEDDGALDMAIAGEVLRYELIVEIMEQRSNIMLVNDDNIILESVRRVPPHVSRRPVMPRGPYESPPPQNKRDPRQATAAGLRTMLDTATGDTARAIVSTYRGVAPLAAREVLFRATGLTAAPLAADLPWEPLAAALRDLYAAAPAPSLVPGDPLPTVFAAYTLTHQPDAVPVASISAAIERFYAPREQVSSHAQRRDALRTAIAATRARITRRRDALRGELEQVAALERLRWEGEMIFAYMHTLAPGQHTLMVEDTTITLDPKRTPVECAQDRFRAYDKAKGAAAEVPGRIEDAEVQLAGIDEIVALLGMADEYDAIEIVAREAQDAGWLPTGVTARDRGARTSGPLRVAATGGWTIYVGRTAKQNQETTFTLGSSDDMWLHVRNVPGSHVIIKSGGRPVPDEVLQEAASYAAYFSPLRNEPAVDIEVAPRHQVRRVRGGPPGLVTYTAERTLRVAPRAPAAAPVTARASVQQPRRGRYSDSPKG